MAEVKDLVGLPPSNNGKKSVILFWASWHDASSSGGQMDVVFRSLASMNQQNVEFFRVEAEAAPELSLKFDITMVPTCIILSESNEIIEKIDGVEPARLTQAISSLSSIKSTSPKPDVTAIDNAESSAAASEETTLDNRLAKLVRASEVMLFMKGTPATPRCGFSRQTVELLTAANIAFGTFDILTDEEVRQGLKTYSDWPTYPQIYVRGELTGGLDVLKEMIEDEGESLAEQFGVEEQKVVAPAQTLEERIKALVNRSRIMLFMKGVPSKPRCGFSRQIVEILEAENVPYDSFSILEDEEVRQGLKKMFDWPTYPQLYVDGELIGGLDVVKELKDEDELGDLLRGE